MSVRIAVIEDSQDNRLLLQVFLEDHFQVDEYESGLIALEQMTDQIPDLILMDISLPVIDGVEVLRRLRAMPTMAKIPVVALTAHAMNGDKEKFLSQGFDAYISKPIWDENILFRAIQDLLPDKNLNIVSS